MQLLDNKFHNLTSTVLQCQTSGSADTTKLLLKLQNGMQVEAVIMHYDTTGMCIACLSVKIASQLIQSGKLQGALLLHWYALLQC